MSDNRIVVGRQKEEEQAEEQEERRKKKERRTRATVKANKTRLFFLCGNYAKAPTTSKQKTVSKPNAQENVH
jgi:hypothetical protein